MIGSIDFTSRLDIDFGRLKPKSINTKKKRSAWTIPLGKTKWSISCSLLFQLVERLLAATLLDQLLK